MSKHQSEAKYRFNQKSALASRRFMNDPARFRRRRGRRCRRRNEARFRCAVSHSIF
jgi:hypothetical protein